MTEQAFHKETYIAVAECVNSMNKTIGVLTKNAVQCHEEFLDLASQFFLAPVENKKGLISCTCGIRVVFFTESQELPEKLDILIVGNEPIIYPSNFLKSKIRKPQAIEKLEFLFKTPLWRWDRAVKYIEDY